MSNGDLLDAASGTIEETAHGFIAVVLGPVEMPIPIIACFNAGGAGKLRGPISAWDIPESIRLLTLLRRFRG